MQKPLSQPKTWLAAIAICALLGLAHHLDEDTQSDPDGLTASALSFQDALAAAQAGAAE